MNLTLFDLDGTLIATDSDHAFGEFLVERGWADREGFRRRNDAFYADYLAGKLDQAAYIDFATAPWRQRDPEQVGDRPGDELVGGGHDRHPVAGRLVTTHQRARGLVQHGQDTRMHKGLAQGERFLGVALAPWRGGEVDVGRLVQLLSLIHI